MDFADEIKTAKPELSANSIKTYNVILKKLYRDIFGDTTTPNTDNFQNVARIMAHLQDAPVQTRKTKLSAVMVLAPMPEYRAQIAADLVESKKQTDRSVMTEKLEASEITPEQMRTVSAALKQDAAALYKKSSLTAKNVQDIQNYVIVNLYHGHIAPRRAIDFTEMFLVPTDTATENYIDMKKSKFVFNKYKTAGTYGTQEIAIPAALKKIIKKWIPLIPEGTNHLLFNANREPLTNVTLNQRLTEIFGPGRGVNSIRHLYLTQNHAETIRGEDRLATDMRAMGSNINQARSYIKINSKDIETK
jgi:hypothetical protein